MPSYLEIARRALQKSPVTEARECERSELSEKRLQCPLSHSGGAYWQAAQDALEAMRDPDYPAGMIFWLDAANPVLYRRLTEILPDRICRLWNEAVPLETFSAALEEWVSTHRTAVSLYRHYQETQTRKESLE